MFHLVNIFILGLFLAGVIVLQIFLSKRENKWLGLILPAINVMFSIITVLGMALYLEHTIGQIIVQFLAAFLLYNIPTVILIAIYIACREKLKKKKEIEKMNIQDLD